MFNRSLPRGVIFLMDLGVCFISLVLAYAVRFNFEIPEVEIRTFIWVFPLVLLTRALSFIFFKSYSGIIRYTSTYDAKRIFFTILTGSGFFALLNPVTYLLWETYAIPYSIIIIDFLATIFMMVTFRIAVKLLYHEFKFGDKEMSAVAIFGAGEAGLITKRTLDRDMGMRYKVIAFFDDDRKKRGKKMEGVPIYNADGQLEEHLNRLKVESLIISVQNLPTRRKQQIVEACLNKKVKVLNVPPVSNWINGQLSFGQIQKIRIEDLLERDPIELDTVAIREQFDNKRILITGAAGSIGSELVRQILRFNPAKVVLLDMAESPLYDLEMEINEHANSGLAEFVIGDIRNRNRMVNVFNTFKPEVIFHAAAYKHVPLMEDNPSEAILTNVNGTRILADLAVEFKADKFVLISTDKAVNPTNIMGASKRIAEIYTQALDQKGATRFVTTRFGNVLGSNGSVIPRFRKQIENRQPITVTHPEITRFFMTIPEACQLVLEAGAIGKGGEIYIFDMGDSVKIVDLAKKMIQLSGLELERDIQIVYTGLRPGEKLYEELLANEENTMPTHHKKILIAKVREYKYNDVAHHIDELVALFEKQDNQAIAQKMKMLVPEFVSNNSIFELLDHKKSIQQ